MKQKTFWILIVDMLVAVAAIVLISLGKDANGVVLLMLVVTIASILLTAAFSQGNVRFSAGLQAAIALLLIGTLLIKPELQYEIIGLAVLLAVEIVFLVIWILWYYRGVKQDIINEYSQRQAYFNADEDDEEKE